MKNISLLFAALFLIAASSCKKKSGDDTPGTSDQLKTYTETLTSPSGSQKVVFNVSYDNEGKISELTSASGQKLSFTYKPNEYTMDIYDGGELQIHEIFFIQNGLIDSTLQNDTYGSVTSEKYFYNPGKQLTKLLQYDLEDEPYLELTTNYAYDANGNLSSTTDTDGMVTTFEYYEDKVDNIPALIPTPYRNANLLKKETVDYGGGFIETLDVTYTFDSKQRISTITQQSSEGFSAVQKFTYR